MKGILATAFLLLVAATAAAHVGSPDVFFEGTAGPYRVLVVVRVPAVIPGVAEVEVRALSGNVGTVRVVPMRIRGLGAELAPVPDVATRAREDPRVFRAQLWLMLRGAWKMQIEIEGDQGKGTLAVPVAAVSTMARPMPAPMKWLLSTLMMLLVGGLVGIVGAAVREGAAEPGSQPSPLVVRWARWAMAGAALWVVGVLWLGNIWWRADAAVTASAVYKVPRVEASLAAPGTLSLKLGNPNSLRWTERIRLDDLVLDHGHLMHLFLVRAPALDRVLHLHPRQEGPGHFVQELPAMPAGRYQVFADIVHATGFPETQIGEITLPEIQVGPLKGDDSSAEAPPFSDKAAAPATSALGGGAHVLWLRDAAPLRAGEAVWLRFRVEDGAGKPAGGLEPYMGMAGHLAVVRADCTVFAHLHPGGSPPMAAVELANGPAASAHSGHAAIPAEIAFPYGFPQAGAYRLFVQVKRGGRVETGVFDALVAEPRQP